MALTLERVRSLRPDAPNELSVEHMPLLEEICQFLVAHMEGTEDATHVVFDHYIDWWLGSQQTQQFRLAIVEDSTVEQFNRHMAALYQLGMPLTMCERLTPEFRFVQDIHILGSTNEMVTADELLVREGCFIRQLGKVMVEIYRDATREHWDAIMFDASGRSKVKGVQKTSIKIVWPLIHVDRDRARQIREYLVTSFNQSQDADLLALKERILGYNSENHWGNVFSEAVYFQRSGDVGVRMPLNDRVSPAPMKIPEHRPFAPWGILRFVPNEGELLRVDEIVRGTGAAEQLQLSDWIKMGSVRLAAGTEVTACSPNWAGPTIRSSDSRGGGGGGGPAGRALGRDAGKVSLRTRTGSDNYGRSGNTRTTRARTEEPTDTVERSFNGTASEFSTKIQEALGGNVTVEEDEAAGTVRCTVTGGSTVVYKTENRRVYITGTRAQLRTLIQALQSIVTPVSNGDGRSTASTQRQTRAGSPTPSRASGSYAVSVRHSAAPARSTTGSVSSVRAGGVVGAAAGQGLARGERRVATKAFAAETDTELGLEMGQHVVVVHDPATDPNADAGTQNPHRWILGKNEATGAEGWFPYSHVGPVPS